MCHGFNPGVIIVKLKVREEERCVCFKENVVTSAFLIPIRFDEFLGHNPTRACKKASPIELVGM